MPDRGVCRMDSDRLLDSLRSLSDDIYLYIKDLEQENAHLRGKGLCV